MHFSKLFNHTRGLRMTIYKNVFQWILFKYSKLDLAVVLSCLKLPWILLIGSCSLGGKHGRLMQVRRQQGQLLAALGASSLAVPGRVSMSGIASRSVSGSVRGRLCVCVVCFSWWIRWFAGPAHFSLVWIVVVANTALRRIRLSFICLADRPRCSVQRYSLHCLPLFVGVMGAHVFHSLHLPRQSKHALGHLLHFLCFSTFLLALLHSKCLVAAEWQPRLLTGG